MEIVFADKDLETLCSDERQQKKRLGLAGARKLRTRLADLQAVVRVTALFAGHPHPLTGDRDGQFALRLDGGCRLVFEPADQPIPRRDDGAVEWAEVTAVRIVFIGDYHD
ncbi:killer suppression protein HigA [Thiocapsa imhoffii]|uniref:Killer suppression protein HigA n=1 Tax=Thiocapsa imhoffii TaxID=382777 RepID=A0A9X1B9M8_9GAMM|nr:killer suppression protein HigA [Thiocapsa imhoffii]